MENRTEQIWIVAAIVLALVGLGITVAVCSGKAEAATMQRETVLATGFAHKGDDLAGDVFICLRQGKGWKAIDDKTPGIAHRTRRCGSLVRITNRRTGRSVLARVVDRGPYRLGQIDCAEDAVDARGFRHASQDCWVRGRNATRRERRSRPDAGWVYLNGADLTPPTRRAIGHNGKETVDLEWR